MGTTTQVMLGDRPQIYAAQKKECMARFGPSNIDRPGTTLPEPNCDGETARRIAKFWIDDWNKANSNLGRISDWATVNGNLYAQTKAAAFRLYLAKYPERGNMNDAALRIFWADVSQMANAMGALTTSKTSWTMLVESVKEAVDENIVQPVKTGLQWGAAGLMLALGLFIAFKE